MKYLYLALAFFYSALPTFANDSLKVILEISFAGDIMQHGPQIKSAYYPVDDNYDYLPCFRAISPSFRQSDLVIANLELTLAGKPYSGYPTFSAPDELAVALKKSGVDVLVTANNHSLDRRKKGLERTIDVLDSLKIPYTGTFKKEEDRKANYPLMLQIKGINIALLNYTYGTNGIPVTPPNIVNMLDTAVMRIDLEKAKSNEADLIIVFTHWGWEYQRLPNEEQKMIAKFCKTLGADMVIGSHPHVLQPIEKEGDFLVVYSLGNFVSNQRDRYKDGGMIFSTKIEFDLADNTKKILEAGYELTWVYKKRSQGGNEYYILPAAHPQSMNKIENEDDLNNLKIFINDAREHFRKYNKGMVMEYNNRVSHQPHFNLMGELTNNIVRQIKFETPKQESGKKEQKTFHHDLPKKQSSIFRIQFLVSGKKLPTSSFDRRFFDNIITEEVGGMTRYLSGNFVTKEEAKDQLMIILNETKYKDAFIVERKPDGY